MAEQKAYQKLSGQRKVTLLEETVLSGDMERLEEVLIGCGTFEFTARALGLACRFGTPDMIKRLAKAKATFRYDESDSKLQSKYSICGNVKYNWGVFARFELMVFADSVRDPEKFGDLRNTVGLVDGAWEREPAPENVRMENLRCICTLKRLKCDQGALLYHAIIEGKERAETILRENKAVFGKQELAFLCSPQPNHRRNQWLDQLGRMDTEQRSRVLNATLDVLSEQEKPLAVSTALMTRFLDSEALIQRLLEEGACAAIDKNQLLREAVVRGSGGTLTLLLEHGFLKSVAVWDDLCRLADEHQNTEHKAILLEYRNKEMATQDPLKPLTL